MTVQFLSGAATSEYVLNSAGASMQMNQNISPAAANVVDYVAVLYSTHAAVGSGAIAVTFGGVSTTQVGTTTANADTAVALFKIGKAASDTVSAAIASGLNAIHITISGFTTSVITNNLMAISLAYQNVQSIGTILTATPASGTNNTITLADGDAPEGAWTVVTIHGVPLAFNFTNYNGTKRVSSPNLIGGARLLGGDLQGAASVTGTATMTSATAGWAAFAIPLAPTPVSLTSVGVAIGTGPPTGRLGIYRVSVPPQERIWPITTTPTVTDGIPAALAEALGIPPNVWAPGMAWQQDPTAVLDYGLDFTGYLAPSDTVVAVQFTPLTTPGLVLSQDVNTAGTMAVCWIDNVPSGALELVACHIIMQSGREDNFTFTVLGVPQ